MCEWCDPEAEYFHSAVCVYDHQVKDYAVLWLREPARIGVRWRCQELLSSQGGVLAIENAPPMTGWQLRRYYHDAIDEALDPLRGDCIALTCRAEALQAFQAFCEDKAPVSLISEER